MNCKYCERPLNQTDLDSGICYTCKVKRSKVRELRKELDKIKPYFLGITKEENAFIDGIEFSVDNGLYVPIEDYRRYCILIRRRAKGGVIE